jgi:hypothetical protein
MISDLTITSAPSTQFIQFFGPGNTDIGKLTWDNGVLHFEGDADASAKIFLQSIAMQAGLTYTPKP